VGQLGWFGELALAPARPNLPDDDLGAALGAPAAVALSQVPEPDPARRAAVLAPALRAFWVAAVAFLAGGGLVLVGLAALIVFLVLAGTGKLRDGLPQPIPHGGVYAETFALWMLLFFVGIRLVAPLLSEVVGGSLLLLEGAAFFLSLVVLAWPVLRGVPWAQVRQDIGWTRGRRPALEPPAGVACWVMSLPLLAVAVMIVLMVMVLESALAGEGDESVGPVRAAHPIVRDLAQGDWWLKLQILFLASVAAPVVEETMFRGVLYRHLREASRRLGTVASFLVSATVVSFLFAAVHPQGLIAVPLLMALAFGFALAREWRGTLLPAMVGHALNNSLVMLIALQLLGD
jgi:membrane protease YdiL (CAAX protease family)